MVTAHSGMAQAWIHIGIPADYRALQRPSILYRDLFTGLYIYIRLVRLILYVQRFPIRMREGRLSEDLSSLASPVERAFATRCVAGASVG